MIFSESEEFRDPDYLTFVSGKPCVVCGRPGEAHHFGGQSDGRGMGHKASDQKLVPLCNDGTTMSHHREAEKLGRDKFEARYGLDFEVISGRLHELYNERKDRYGSS
jgi:hypothetical protein